MGRSASALGARLQERLRVAVDNSDAHRLPTDFRRLVASTTVTATNRESAEVPLVLSLFRPFALRELDCYCSYRVSLGGRVGLEEGGPSADAVAALFMGWSRLALAVERLKGEHQITCRVHNLCCARNRFDR